jgi:hypothetical protein
VNGHDDNDKRVQDDKIGSKIGIGEKNFLGKPNNKED